MCFASVLRWRQGAQSDMCTSLEEMAEDGLDLEADASAAATSALVEAQGTDSKIKKICLEVFKIVY